MRFGLRCAHETPESLITCARWVLDPSLTKSGSSSRGTYNYTKSHTVRDMNESFDMGYGVGVVKGHIISETVTIAGLTFDNVTMGIANDSAPAFLGQPSIGLLGLGPQPTYGMVSL